MNVLVTAGNTMALIDKVRCVTNIFTGRTGASIALAAKARGHRVTLLTSHPEALDTMAPGGKVPTGDGWDLWRYRTFEDLADAMEREITSARFDAVIHCAAVSDYLSAGVYAPAEGTRFDGQAWHGSPPALADRSAGKVRSDEGELWLRLVRAPKLVDRIRDPWGFRGVLVKFKLEVGRGDADLIEVAERSRLHSQADLMVANTLEGAPMVAFLGPVGGEYAKVSRQNLAERLLDRVEILHAMKG